MKLLKSNGFPVALVLLGILSMWAGFDQHAKSARIEADGISATGTVRKAEARPHRRGTEYVLTVGFFTEDRRFLQREVRVSKEFFDSQTDVSRKTVPKVGIRYNPADTSELMIEGTGGRDASDYALMITGGAVAIAGGIGYFLYLMLRDKPQRA